MYFDIWDIQSDKLLYRRVVSGYGGTFGIPLKFDRVNIKVWPSYVDGNHMYLVISADILSDVMPSISEYDNPVIIELELK